jgi:hypothetical protein
VNMLLSKLNFFKLTYVKSIFFILISLFLAQSNVFSQTAPKYSNEFLAIGIGADALGLGGSVVAQTDNVNSGYWNPAGLTKVDKWLEIGLMHSEYFAGIAKYDYLGLAHKLNDKSSIGFSFIRFAVDDIPNTTQLIDNNGRINYDKITSFTAADYAYILSYARKMNIKGLSFGANFKVINRQVGDFAKSWGFGLDAGLQYHSPKNWKFGLMARDITSTFNAWVFNLDDQTKEVFAATGNEIPSNGLEITLPKLILAAYKKVEIGKKGIYTAAELDVDITTDGRRNTLIQTNAISIDPHLGIEVGYKSFLAVRGGLSNLQYVKDFDDTKSLNLQPNIGLGITIKNFKIDYAFTDIGDASVALYSHVISIKLKLDRPSNMH